ncbi:MAG: hypothetical protein MUF16_25460 [Burkholderiaceae bacterium]|nr:hypothetical protein [Burkholderiaceae bacterium]
MKTMPATKNRLGSERACAAALCLLAAAACSDGCPTEDIPYIDPARMTQAQLLAALDEPGVGPHLGKRWRYALHPDCELEITVRDGGRKRDRVVLEGAAIATRPADGMTEIWLVPRAGGQARAVRALETGRWSDTVRAKPLLTHLEMRCGQPVPPSA